VNYTHFISEESISFLALTIGYFTSTYRGAQLYTTRVHIIWLPATAPST